MTQRLHHRLTEHARATPASPALEWTEPDVGTPVLRVMTYAQLLATVDAAAVNLRGAFPPGSVVILRCPNSPACVVGLLACLRAGLKVFPVGTQVGETELRAAAVRTAARGMIAPPAEATQIDGTGVALIDAASLLSGGSLSIRGDRVPLPSAASPSPACPPDAPGLLLQSSGTTGLPKIVYRDPDSLDAVAENVAAAAGLREDDRVLGVAQLTHSFGVENAMLAPLWAGACVHLARTGEAAGLAQAIMTHRITVLPAVPFLFELLAQAHAPREPAPALRLAYSAGAPLPREVFDAFRQRFGQGIGQLYGATEMGSVTFNHPGSTGFDAASVGLPMGGVQIRILDAEGPDPDHPLPAGREGHVAVAAPSMFRGYLDAPTTELRDGFFLTGDLGRLDEAGRLTLTGRLKLLIDVAGMKVNPQEVEQTLLEHPQVRECVVVALPVSQTLERIKALVVVRNPAAFSVEDLRQFAAARLSAYKVPRVVEVVAALPRSSTGKILRQKLV